MSRALKFFVRDPSRRPPSLGNPAIHALDAFRLSGPLAAGGEWIVTADANGALTLTAAHRVSELPIGVQREVIAHGQQGPLRQLDASEVYLLAVESLDELADFPGLNDPVTLRGALFGPFPSDEPEVSFGSLGATRGDVLFGALRGLMHPFHATGEGVRASRWQHLLMPGDEHALLEAGRALVLAFPLSPAGLHGEEPGNELLVLELLQELLSRMRGDPAAGGTALSARSVPVANLAAVAAELRRRGFEVGAGVASRPRRGLLGSLFPEKVQLPRAADVAEFAQLAEEALALIPDWPLPRARALAVRTRLPTASWAFGLSRGLSPVQSDDGRFERRGRELVSVPHRRSFSLNQEERLSASWRALHFAVDRAFATWCSGSMELAVECFGSEPGDLSAEVGYGMKLQPIERGAPLMGGGEWRVVRLRVPYLLIEGEKAWPSLRLCICGPSELRIRRVTLTPDAELPIVESRARALAAPPEDPRDKVLDMTRARHEVGCAYVLEADFGLESDCPEEPRRSPLLLLEDGAPLPAPHSGHADIRERGLGRYSHWNGTLWFSSSDNTDPRRNGRRYTFRRGPTGRRARGGHRGK